MAATYVQTEPVTDERTVIGWQGVRFYLPPDWNMTGFSMDRKDGYVKVDSPGTMFVQVKWSDPKGERPKTLGAAVFSLWKSRRKAPAAPKETPDLRSTLETFLKQTGKAARKSKGRFEYKIKPETTEANGERVAHHFTWTGGGQGQGKIWFCKTCGRVVIAQVVGQARDNVAGVASELFSSIKDHGEDGWNTWALYDMVAGVPEEFVLKRQQLMSGYLKLDFEKRGGEKLRIERWGLANVTRKKFTLADWFRHTAGLWNYRTEPGEMAVQGHAAVRATGKNASIIARAKALRDALLTTWRPATRYDGCAWECEENNKIYALQLWHARQTEGLLEEVAERCECH